ncbi:hypothetical protein [Pluralibacter gergoviae]|uniref:hypothetical protein n=1 Tax=Pluralibacter gergoviae TaxID=61647 RepID=UPI00330A45A8|nr:hypothetical protein [Pluralibacter gergoviae]
MPFKVGDSVVWEMEDLSVNGNPVISMPGKIIATDGSVSIYLPDEDFNPYNTGDKYPIAAVIDGYPFSNLVTQSGVEFSIISDENGTCLSGGKIYIS